MRQASGPCRNERLAQYAAGATAVERIILKRIVFVIAVGAATEQVALRLLQPQGAHLAWLEVDISWQGSRYAAHHGAELLG